LRIGQLNKRVVLQYANTVSDSMGGTIQTWNDSITTWAAIWPVSGREQVNNMAVQGTISHRIRVRYYEGVATWWRAKFGTRIFNIISVVNPEEKNEFLDLVCKEEV